MSEFDKLGIRKNKARGSFTIDESLLVKFNEIVKKEKKQKSAIIEDLIKIYINSKENIKDS